MLIQKKVRKNDQKHHHDSIIFTPCTSMYVQSRRTDDSTPIVVD